MSTSVKPNLSDTQELRVDEELQGAKGQKGAIGFVSIPTLWRLIASRWSFPSAPAR